MIEFEDQAYTTKKIIDNPEWATDMLNDFYSENHELRKYLDIDRVRRELFIPDDYPDEYIQDWFGHPDFGRH